MFIYNLYGRRISLEEAISSSKSNIDVKHSNLQVNSPWDYELQRFLIQGGRQLLTPKRLPHCKRSIQSAGSRLLQEYKIKQSEYEQDMEQKHDTSHRVNKPADNDDGDGDGDSDDEVWNIEFNGKDYSSKKHSLSADVNTLNDIIQKIEDNQGMNIDTFNYLNDDNKLNKSKEDIRSSSPLSNSTSSCHALLHSSLHAKTSRTSSSSSSTPTFPSSSFNEIPNDSNDEIDISNEFKLHSMKKIRINREKYLTYDAVKILTLPSKYRTESMIHSATVSVIATTEAFSEFPIAMQKAIIEKAWYEKYEARRMIIRQGQPPLNFYFIISGSVVVSVSRKDKQTGEPYEETVAFLKAGQSFGELALIYGGKRSATIICKTSVELLVMSHDEFNKIFMQNTQHHEAEHITFLRTIPLIPNQIVNHLNGVDSSILLFTFFRRNVTICIDSNQSNWIYIIKTGQCRILKDVELKPKHLKSTVKTHRPKTEFQYYFDSSKHHEKSKLNTQNSAKKLDNKNVKIFIELKILEPNSVFGLESIAFEPFGGTTSVSLVSDGAECVAINKKFFIEHCPTNF
ncbi:unnamed protein product [Schistosoma mattheei]|uniref:Cyclic nucleotide-binding domain-containing protein n=2 Tax=Schistosoma TaxID=6181 RepID=A0AA85BT98_9TREM|nr:unnamed protein product [Schistosoma mattheei]